MRERKSTISYNIYKRVFQDYLKPCCEARGFRGQKEILRLREGDCVFQVGVDFMADRPQDAGLVQIGACVGFQSVWKLLSRCNVFSERSVLSAAGIGGCIRRILPNSASVEWEWLEPTSDPDAIGRTLVAEFNNYVFPFLDHYSRIENAISYWRAESGPSGFALAAAHVLRGETSDATTVIDEMRHDAEKELRANQTRQNAAWLQEVETVQSFLIEVMSQRQ